MIEGIESLYQVIAEAIDEAIPEAWSIAIMEGIFYSDGSTYFGEHVRKADLKSIDFGTPANAELAFRDVRRKFKESAKKVWGRAAFELHSDGKFDMKWSYDNCDENGDTIFDEDEELKRHEERRKRLSQTGRTP